MIDGIIHAVGLSIAVWLGLKVSVALVGMYLNKSRRN